MKVSQLQHGETCTLLLTPESRAVSPEIEKGREVRLVFPRTSDELLLSTGDVAQAVVSADEITKRRVANLRETDPARLCWLVARRENKGEFELTVQVHRFRSKIEWTDKVAFCVDERIVERVAQLESQKMNPEKVCQWLADQVFIPSGNSSGYVRAIATGSPEVSGRFRLLGARVCVDVASNGETLRVESLVTLHGGRGGFRPPEYLIEAHLDFVDATLAGKMRHSVRAQLDRLVAESGSYLALWEKYQSIESANLIRRARELGWLSYYSFEYHPSGLWRFIVKDTENIQLFKNQLSASGQEEVEVDAQVPPELIEDRRNLQETDERRSTRVAIGTVERICVDRKEVILRPLDEESDVLPPPKGVLFAALQGDRKRLERRKHAVLRLKSADARLPQLGLIIEGENPYVRRTDRVRAFTPAVRRVFEDEPTPEQRLAIDMAVNTPDIVVIQGPPGTGKTKVIAAITARLAELEGERPEIAGRTLLTSYQHEAVDNAASKSIVFGLPPVRFGGRRGSRPSFDQVQRWAIQACDHVDAVLASLPEERPLAMYRSVRDQVASYASGRMSPEELRHLLDELIELPAGNLPTEIWERLRRLRRGSEFAVIRTADLERELMRKAVRALRVTPEAFSDDGPRKARQALERLGTVLSEDEREMLSLAANVLPGGTFEKIEVLASIRDSLLDRLNPEDIPGERRRIDEAILDALNAAVSALYNRMRQSPGGVADALQEYADALRESPDDVARLLQQYAAVYAATCQQAVIKQVVVAKGGENMGLEFENVIVDEAARANPLDLFIPISLANRRIILVGDHRQLPHLLDPEVEEALSNTVREQEEHALKESLFQRFFERLPLLRQEKDFIRVVTLRDQFRMHPALGKFVSDTFYKRHGESFRSPRPASNFAHAIPGYQRAGRPVCAVWKNIAHREGEERPGRSKSRPAEARWIAKEIRRILVDVGTDVTIGVISFYRAQVDELLECLVLEGIAERDSDSGYIKILDEWGTLERPYGKRVERLCVGTVDAFQGKEFDIVFLSVTRSNALPASTENDRRRKFGHLMLENRLCVAMSRQRLLLVAVGDRGMFETEDARGAVPGLSSFLVLCGGEDGLVT